jgi:hypothetical protein
MARILSSYGTYTSLRRKASSVCGDAVERWGIKGWTARSLFMSAKTKYGATITRAGSYVTILKIKADGNTTPTHLTNLENPTSMIMAYVLRFTYHAWHG